MADEKDKRWGVKEEHQGIMPNSDEVYQVHPLPDARPTTSYLSSELDVLRPRVPKPPHRVIRRELCTKGERSTPSVCSPKADEEEDYKAIIEALRCDKKRLITLLMSLRQRIDDVLK